MKNDIFEMLKATSDKKASDLHITVGLPPMIRVDGALRPLVMEDPYTPEESQKLIFSLMDKHQISVLEEKGQVDYSYSIPGWGRFRVNAYMQRNSYSMACRVVAAKIPTLEDLSLPETLRDLTRLNKGLILVTGPTGSGKSTTLASMIDIINEERKSHILTLEDPIEYLHRHKNSMVNQREVGHDTDSYSSGLRAALREDPDVILVGEMRDLDSISIALTAAETGHLVLSTLHTVGSAKTIDRVIDVFPPHQQQQVKVQLSTVLQGVISQQLISKKDQPGRIVALEIMLANPAIRNLIREGKTHQVNSIIQMSAKTGMVTMDNYLFDLYNKGLITMDNALFYSLDQENMKKKFM
ncbi:type IV pilus twitching motility protein PilT [Alkalibacter saccharofermentans]|uniref:Twitching motility protein PilT n=1 Tax=Alkalibacter saccharofermentans DSM 14828 TaxID=1120975 RepID=A0A1M4S870_9FIRM|nr:type IV pilus twitching motility protein PilT [Alkalibacter saccharofermentans]SHE28365.1 twitching motility protein PilT [Alkalibacter saccharofermentans DSM 14828]